MSEVNPNVALPAGVYQHWKGPLYLVLGLAHDANADELYRYDYNPDSNGRSLTPLGEREVVVYVGLQLDAAHEGARLAVRTLQDFFAHVCVADTNGDGDCASCARLGDASPCRVRRFSYVGPRFVVGMVSSRR